MEEFLDKLPAPEIVQAEPMDRTTEAGPDRDSVPNVPMETGAPESSPRGEASGVKVEPTEGCSTKDEHMGETEEASDADMVPERGIHARHFP